MKKFLCVLLSLAMLLCLAACGGNNGGNAAADGVGNDGDASNDPAVKLVYAEVNPLDTIVGQTDTFFAEKVAELTGGNSLASNIRLVYNNAKVAAQTAVHYCNM